MTDLVAKEKIPRIREAIAKYGDISLKLLKNKLGDDYGYSEIRAVIEWIKRNGK